MKKYNLLSSDAIHVSSCKLQQIEYMASNDSDFERVGFLNLWMPGKSSIDSEFVHG
jgi:predicted nucleic acid-binding protein